MPHPSVSFNVNPTVKALPPESQQHLRGLSQSDRNDILNFLNEEDSTPGPHAANPGAGVVPANDVLSQVNRAPAEFVNHARDASAGVIGAAGKVTHAIDKAYETVGLIPKVPAGADAAGIKTIQDAVRPNPATRTPEGTGLIDKTAGALGGAVPTVAGAYAGLPPSALAAEAGLEHADEGVKPAVLDAAKAYLTGHLLGGAGALPVGGRAAVNGLAGVADLALSGGNPTDMAAAGIAGAAQGALPAGTTLQEHLAKYPDFVSDLQRAGGDLMVQHAPEFYALAQHVQQNPQLLHQLAQAALHDPTGGAMAAAMIAAKPGTKINAKALKEVLRGDATQTPEQRVQTLLAQQHYPWAIITANKSGLGDPMDPVNMGRNQTLKAELQRLGYQPLEMQGMYRMEGEPMPRQDGSSFFALGIPPEQAHAIGKKYGQESIVVGGGGNPTGLLYTNEDSGRLDPAALKKTVYGNKALQKDYFSVIPDERSGQQIPFSLQVAFGTKKAHPQSSMMPAPAEGDITADRSNDYYNIPKEGAEAMGYKPAKASVLPTPNPDIAALANDFNAQNGRAPVIHTNVAVDPVRARQIANAYEAMESNPNDKKVQKAYKALAEETKAQYLHAQQNGINFEPWTQPGQPYANAAEMAADVNNNKHLSFFQGGEAHPLMSQVDVETGLSPNDMFRAVHDLYGHAAGGHSFGPSGEENAWMAHSQMFSPEARKAMTTETRGQNSWVNFGPQNFDENGQHTNLPLTQRPYAKQKVGFLPEQFQTPGVRTWADWTPEEREAFGLRYGVPGLGKETPPQDIGGGVMIPGGLEGRFTHADMMRLKSTVPNPESLPQAARTALEQKMARSTEPARDAQGNVEPVDLFNRWLFGMLSPNTPLTQNEMLYRRLAPQSMEDIKQLANMKDKTDKEIGQAFNVQTKGAGGLGLRSSANLKNVAKFADLFQRNPQWFAKRPNESWADLVERVSSQVPGMSAKVGSFGGVWQSPLTAEISAIDRHMALQFLPKMFDNPARRAEWQNKVLDSWNGSHQNNKAKTFDKLIQLNGGSTYVADRALGMLGSLSPKFRYAKGNINPDLSPTLQNMDWIEEPSNVKAMSTAYRHALDENERLANEQGLSLFPSQWALWDNYRRRLEPHEVMYPDLYKVPPMPEDWADAANVAHREAGYKSSTKELDENQVKRLKPARPTANPGSLTYLSLPLAMAAASAIQDKKKR